MSSSAQRIAAAIWFSAGLMGAASAQTAYRCDNNGQTVYSDKPCPAGKAVVGTQETPEQKAATKAANDQMRKDNADLNKRLSDREKLEAQERAAARKAAGKPTSVSAKGKGRASGKVKTVKAAKKAKPAKSPRKKNAAKSDTVMSLPQ